jgi:UDP-N-acetylmuramyl pentapeptide phosphotransferase/UDP-N-acetylglucosamine-1-phosphate transferase
LPPAVTGAVLVVWIVGVLNITNFMDGMDGLAGSQVATAFGALAIVFASVAPGASAAATFSAGIAAASLGFLAHNAPPARMFMGDAGSTFLGYAYAGLAVLGLSRGVPLAVSALAMSPFLLDGTFTLFRRALRGEKVWRAHRSHLYQRAVQTGLGHREVLLVYLAWMVFGGAAALVGAEDGRTLLAGWAGSLAALVAVWRWVTGREAATRAPT